MNILENAKNLSRIIKFFFQRLTRGWDDRETWDFQESFLKWALPRLKRVKDISIAFPPEFTEVQWLNFQSHLIQRVESCLNKFENQDDLTWDEMEDLRKETQEVAQIIIDNLNNFSW